MNINLIHYEKYWVSFDIENLRFNNMDDIRLSITFSNNSENFIHKEYGTHSFEECTKYLDCVECQKTARDIIERSKVSKNSPFKKWGEKIWKEER